MNQQTYSSSVPNVSPLLAASLFTLILSLIPFAGIVTYPFLTFATFIHETSHSLMAILTGGTVESVTVHWNGSGLTTSRGGVQFLIASAGYVGTTFFGALLLWLSKNRKWVRLTLAGCALLIAAMTMLFAGHVRNLPILAGIALGALLLYLSVLNPSRKVPAMVAGLGLLGAVLLYLFLTGSLFTWAVGFFLTLMLLCVVRFCSLQIAHFFLSFLAVQCSLNALYSLRNLLLVSIRTNACTDARTVAALTGLPPWFWTGLWILQSFVILGVALWFYSRHPSR